MGRPKVAIVIPAYNEQQTVGKIALCAGQYGQVFVVDDHSKDHTADEAKGGGAEVILNQHAKGYGGALTTGLRHCYQLGFDFAFTLDADGEHDPDILPDALLELNRTNSDLFVGIRPRKQRLAEVLISLHARRQFGLHDVFCGFKGYRFSMLAERKIKFHEQSSGIELALRMIRNGAGICQRPVTGTSRQDLPRFGNRLSANYWIFSSYLREVRRG